MTPEERQSYIDIGLRMRNIQLHPELLKKVLEIVDLVDRKKGNANIQDVIELENKIDTIYLHQET
jgi:hypothetical protein